MATKKSTTVVDKESKVDIPQDITKCLFFQRLPYRLTEEQWNFIKAVWNTSCQYTIFSSLNR